MAAAPALPIVVTEVHEFVDRGYGLPRFVIGYEFEIGGQRCVVVRVVSQLGRPERAVVEVEAVS